jgi:hypothetical protein
MAGSEDGVDVGEERIHKLTDAGMPPVQKATTRDRGAGPFKRLILRGATILDGTGAPQWSPADIVVEGEIKAMCTFARLDDSKVRMVGMPCLTPGDDTIEKLGKADRVTLIVDPGARKQAWDLTGKIGRHKCWVLIPPMKIDDGILANNMTKRYLELMLRTARPAA